MSYIDVDKFAEKICNFQSIDEDAANAMIWLLRTFPTADVVEVVRYKDCKGVMKKDFDALTVAEIRKLVKCKDDNGEHLCNQGCIFHYDKNYCYKNAFFNRLYNSLDEKNLITTDEYGKTIVELKSEDTE